MIFDSTHPPKGTVRDWLDARATADGIAVVFPETSETLTWRSLRDDARDMAQKMAISPPNATRLVKQMEAKGLVRRARSQTSNRVVLVCLTERGASVDRACGQKLEAALRASVDAVLNEADRERLRALLNRICDTGSAKDIDRKPTPGWAAQN